MMLDGAMMGGFAGLGWIWVLLIGLLFALAIAALFKYLLK
jgi:hypothetical protein